MRTWPARGVKGCHIPPPTHTQNKYVSGDNLYPLCYPAIYSLCPPTCILVTLPRRELGLGSTLPRRPPTSDPLPLLSSFFFGPMNLQLLVCVFVVVMSRWLLSCWITFGILPGPVSHRRCRRIFSSFFSPDPQTSKSLHLVQCPFRKLQIGSDFACERWLRTKQWPVRMNIETYSIW